MENPAIVTGIDGRGRATVTLNRPGVHNAFDDTLIRELTDHFRRLDENPDVRVVVLAAEGKSFSAGADLNWMRRMADYSHDENLRDSMGLAEMMRVINGLSRPVVCRVQGPAFGGGVGLVACCDVAIASDRASFCLSEVKLGLIPAVISPYVVAAMGSRAARRYFLTAERFDAAEARRLGLVHEVTTGENLDETVDAICELLSQNGPRAIAEAKQLVAAVSRGPITGEMIADTAEKIARIRASDEGREGVAAFLGKRKPSWTEG